MVAEGKTDLGTIQVQGVGEVNVEPDLLMVDLGVVTEGKTVQAAQEQNRRQVGKVLHKLKANGVERKDVRTLRYAIIPVYDHSPAKEGKPPRLVAYRVENVLSVKIRNLERAGSIIDATVGDGANQVMNLRFGLSNETQARQRAFRLAVQEAVQKGQLMAEAVGKEITGLQSVREQPGGGPRPLSALGEGARVYGETPVAPGELTIRASVTAVFTINSRWGQR